MRHCFFDRSGLPCELFSAQQVIHEQHESDERGHDPGGEHTEDEQDSEDSDRCEQLDSQRLSPEPVEEGIEC